MKLIALYKAYSGGEWFEASLDSIKDHVDVIVVMMSATSWTGDDKNDCEEPLQQWRNDNPGVDVCVVRGTWKTQENQYADGLTTIAREFGEDSKVLVIDTDEIWEDDQIMKLRAEMEGDNETFFFRSHLHTYLKSVLYQVWPLEPADITVGLASTNVPEVIGRFHPWGKCTGMRHKQTGLVYHHMAYVRESEDKIRDKFRTTSNQESTPSNPNWFGRVWDKLPFGYNLHMSPGLEHLWEQAHGLLPLMLPDSIRRHPLGEKTIEEAFKFWQNWLEHGEPEHTLIPQPNEEHRHMYQAHLDRWTSQVSEWINAMKTTVLESLCLADFAHTAESHTMYTPRIVEIGSGSGGSMIALALGSTKAELISVDPFTPYDEENYTGLATGVTEGDEAKFDAHAKLFGYAHRVRKIKRPSDRAATEIEDKSCAMVYVDGNHTYEIAKSDLELYWEKLMPGGILIGHDYTVRFPGVLRAVREWEHYEDIRVPHGTSLFYVVKR
jgi:hypothetical protein